MTQSEKLYSICPAGEQFLLPAEEDYAKEFNKIKKLVDSQRRKGRDGQFWQRHGGDQI